MKWQNYTSSELEHLIIEKGFNTCILPFGSIEQHGRHLDVGFDTLIAERISNDLAKKRNILVLPTLKFGESSHHLNFYGTLSLKKNTIKLILNDLVESLIISGIKKLIIINGHGGNYSVLSEFTKECDFNVKIEIVHDAEDMLLFDLLERFKSKYSLEELGYHAGLLETSLGQYIFPDAVRDELLDSYNEKSITLYDTKTIIEQGLKRCYPTGVIGLPQKSNIEFGKEVYETLMEIYDGYFFKD